MRDFRRIKVWSKAHLLTLEIYKVTAVFPKEERYGLTSQLRRSAASIAYNIAEGFWQGWQHRTCAILTSKHGLGRGSCIPDSASTGP